MVTSSASPPAWWSSRSAVLPPEVTTNDGIVTTNYIPNDYAAVTQGQFKQFTSKAIAELNAHLPGGAGTNLNSILTNWQQDYATNDYSSGTNPFAPYKPSDLRVTSIGQVKNIAKLIDAQLLAANYIRAYPTWSGATNITDLNIANIGQVKAIFAFEIAAPQSPGNLTVSSDGTDTTITWSDPVFTVQTYTLQYSTDGGTTWTTLTTVAGNVLSTTITGLTLGNNYSYRLVASNPSGSSSPSTSDAAPLITLATPTGATLVP